MKQSSKIIMLILLSISGNSVSALTSDLRISNGRARRCPLMLQERRRLYYAHPRNSTALECEPCANPFDNDEFLDRREAFFAMLGTVWATTGIPLLFPQPSNAVSGQEAKIVLPNPLEAMEARASNQQCLVETLGNRECLVYEGDAANRLYRGIETPVLVSRIETAAKALQEVPSLVEQKKWSQVSGILLGPLGDLVRTMGQISTTPEAKQYRSQTKIDLYTLNAAIERKDGSKALEASTAATKDLAAFLQAI